MTTTTVKEPETRCRACDQLVFHAAYRWANWRSVRWDDFPHTCGYTIDKVDGRTGKITMGTVYYKIGALPGDGRPVYRLHKCKKADREFMERYNLMIHLRRKWEMFFAGNSRSSS